MRSANTAPIRRQSIDTKIIFAAALIAGAASTATALEIPRGSSQDSRVRFVNYQPFNITRIVGTLRSSVQVEFAADEEIAHVALGNSVAWEVAPAGSILFLKPRENQPVTNISVVTTRRDGSTRNCTRWSSLFATAQLRSGRTPISM